jgi:hypothetical protein
MSGVWSDASLTAADRRELAREDREIATLERATYDSAGAQLLRTVTARETSGVQWSPTLGWHDGGAS